MLPTYTRLHLLAYGDRGGAVSFAWQAGPEFLQVSRGGISSNQLPHQEIENRPADYHGYAHKSAGPRDGTWATLSWHNGKALPDIQALVDKQIRYLARSSKGHPSRPV